MIFVTVGTHEQGLERLLIELDNLIENGSINEEVVAQIGYSSYEPRNYQYKKMIGYDEMDSYVQKARIIITHGGPGSIFHPLQYGKIPIVVPRNPKFNEHVDNHQILFTRRLDDNSKLIGVYNIKELKGCIMNYEKLQSKCMIDKTNGELFIQKFNNLINNMLIKR